MNFRFVNLIDKNQLSLFFILSFFSSFLLFTISKGFIKNEEFSDIFFLISSVVFFEIIYLFYLNNKKIFIEVNFTNFLTLHIIFYLIYTAWNLNVLESYLEQIYQFIFNLILIIPTLIFSNTKILNISQSEKYDKLLLISIISTFASGLFYQLDFFLIKNFIFIFFLFILTLTFNKILKRTNKFLDIIFSLIIFILLSKIFLLSSSKDIFHYSWYLGPINSLNEYGHNLLDNVPSQYGYLSILLIHKLSLLTNLQSTDLLILMIFSFFIFFYVIFFKKIKSLINLPYSIVALFLSFLVFANLGFNTLSGAMFIPSSSVYRFLPSLFAIIIFTKLINSPNYKNIFIFLLFFLISLFWSFESSFFILFSLSAYFFVKFFYLIFVSKKYELQNYLKRNLIKFLIFGLILFFFLSFFLINKDVTLFYEYIINTKLSFLTKEIEPNKVTFLFLFLLLLCFMILRESITDLGKFNYNILWFALFVSYSTYFLQRSVDSNLFNILPFILFSICSMKIDSKKINFIRKYSLYVIILYSIISALFTIILNKNKFIDNLKNKNLLVLPNFLKNDYLPNNETLKVINDYKNTPLTIISGKYIHEYNNNLQSGGYGLPILPLEHFNILNYKRKNDLIKKLFDLNSRHLVLCLYDCEFYKSNNHGDNRNKIFLGKNINYFKIFEKKNTNKKEILYLLKK